MIKRIIRPSVNIAVPNDDDFVRNIDNTIPESPNRIQIFKKSGKRFKDCQSRQKTSIKTFTEWRLVWKVWQYVLKPFYFYQRDSSLSINCSGKGELFFFFVGEDTNPNLGGLYKRATGTPGEITKRLEALNNNDGNIWANNGFSGLIPGYNFKPYEAVQFLAWWPVDKTNAHDKNNAIFDMHSTISMPKTNLHLASKGVMIMAVITKNLSNYSALLQKGSGYFGALHTVAHALLYAGQAHVNFHYNWGTVWGVCPVGNYTNYSKEKVCPLVADWECEKDDNGFNTGMKHDNSGCLTDSIPDTTLCKLCAPDWVCEKDSNGDNTGYKTDSTGCANPSRQSDTDMCPLPVPCNPNWVCDPNNSGKEIDGCGHSRSTTRSECIFSGGDGGGNGNGGGGGRQNAGVETASFTKLGLLALGGIGAAMALSAGLDMLKKKRKK